MSAVKGVEMSLIHKPNPGREVLDAARQFFEPQLERLRLAESQIGKQSLDQLRGSLADVNDAILNPSSVGVLRLTYTAKATLAVTAQDTAHIEWASCQSC